MLARYSSAMRRALVLAILVVPLVLEACTTYCTLVGCASTVEMCVPLATTTHLRVCRNSTCSEVLYSPAESYVTNALGPISQYDGCVSVEPPTDGENGDVFTVTGWDADGNVVDDYRWTATYTPYYPNGERCGPECQRATLTDTP